MTTEELNRLCQNSFISHLGMVFTGFTGDVITAEIEITPAHLQPHGIVHGGVYISLAETLAGAGSDLLVAGEGKTAMGTHVTSTHIAPAMSGLLKGEGRLVHQGIFKHIWDIEIKDGSGKLISMSRVTNSVREIKPEKEH
jgi:1,4-dihydroxy-2-naphthoyl-CoA hydrolase